jgi:hypothetical protein
VKSFYAGNLSNQDISSELTVQSFTATRDSLLVARVKLTGLSQSATGRTIRVLIDGAMAPTKSLSDGTATSMVLVSDPLPIKSGEQVDVKVAGAAGDTSVGIDGEIFGVDAHSALDRGRPSSPAAGSLFDDAHRCRARLANKVLETVETRVLEVRDEDGETTMFTLTPAEQDGVITLEPA